MSQVPLEVSNFFLAMQVGKPGADALRAMFAEDAVYEEPFTGETRRHEGRDAIMSAMALGFLFSCGLTIHLALVSKETTPM